MAESQLKRLNARYQQKIDTEENWNKATNFIPLKGEVIIYADPDNQNYIPRIKIGDGITTVSQLPFSGKNNDFYVDVYTTVDEEWVSNKTFYEIVDAVEKDQYVMLRAPAAYFTGISGSVMFCPLKGLTSTFAHFQATVRLEAQGEMIDINIQIRIDNNNEVHMFYAFVNNDYVINMIPESTNIEDTIISCTHNRTLEQIRINYALEKNIYLIIEEDTIGTIKIPLSWVQDSSFIFHTTMPTFGTLNDSPVVEVTAIITEDYRGHIIIPAQEKTTQIQLITWEEED